MNLFIIRACPKDFWQVPGKSENVLMVKELLLVRHAKSDHFPDLEDHERPINTRGRDASLQLAQYLKAQHLIPDLVLSSTAKRTRETVDHCLKGIGKQPVPVKFRNDLYLATPGEILYEIQTTDNSVNRLMLVGHNPGIHQLAVWLAGASPSCQHTLLEGFPTAAMALFLLAIHEWQAMSPDKSLLKEWFVPKRHLC